MNRLLLLLTILIIWVGLSAQWSQSPDFPTVIDTTTTDQDHSQIAITSDGYTYICWYATFSGSYSLFLQRINPLGVNAWDNPIVLVSNDSEIDNWNYKIITDHEGNAIIIYDTMVANIRLTYITKYSPGGQCLWNPQTHFISTQYAGNSDITCTTSNKIVVAWAQEVDDFHTIQCRAYTPGGTLAGNQISISDSLFMFPKLVPSVSDIVWLLYISPVTNYTSIGSIYANKITSTGVLAWSNPIEVNCFVNYEMMLHLSACSDETGGVAIAWYDDRNNDTYTKCYVQRITSEGATLFQTNGATVSLLPNSVQTDPIIYYDTTDQMCYVIWNSDDDSSSMYGSGVFFQKINYAGQKMWNANGLVIAPQPLGDSAFAVGISKAHTGFLVTYAFGYYSGYEIPTHRTIHTLCIDSSGFLVWSEDVGSIATNNSYKIDTSSAAYNQDCCIVAWIDSWQTRRLMAMRINADGSLGYWYSAPENLMYINTDINDINLHWDMPATSAAPAGYKVYRNGVYMHLINNANQTSDHVINNPEGIWDFTVSAFWNCGIESSFSEPLTVNISNPSVENLTYQLLNPSNLRFNWSMQPVLFPPMGYNLYRNNQLFRYIAGCDSCFYTLSNIEVGHWSFCIRALWSDGFESNASNSVIVDITASEDNYIEPGILTLLTYPNPFHKDIIISCSKITKLSVIKIFNLKGQVLHTWKLNAKDNLNISWDGNDDNDKPVAPGVYLVKMLNGQETRTLKILKY